MAGIPYEVVEITGEPYKNQLRLDKHGQVDQWWAVPVKMKAEYEIFDSVVTFETLEEALQLQKGEVFFR